MVKMNATCKSSTNMFNKQNINLRLAEGVKIFIDLNEFCFCCCCTLFVTDLTLLSILYCRLCCCIVWHVFVYICTNGSFFFSSFLLNRQNNFEHNTQKTKNFISSASLVCIAHEKPFNTIRRLHFRYKNCI